MTRNLFVGSIALLFVVIFGVVVGVASAAPGVVMLSTLCALPSFIFCLGAAIGRASNEFEIVSKARTVGSVTAARRRPMTQGEILS